jgi:integrase/recombinase XerD
MVSTVNVSASALRFFFKVTLKRQGLAEELVSTRKPRRLPVALSPEEVVGSSRRRQHNAHC